MALSEQHRKIVNRAKLDPEFRLRLLKEVLRLAVKLDPKILERAVIVVDQK